ncbi:MAG: GWxTD domain-containing protein [Candidatus Aminicenantales bacterium]
MTSRQKKKTSRRKNSLGFCFALLLCLFHAQCTRPAAVALDPESRAFYEYARLIMTSEENKIFSRLQDENSRQEFIEEFWAKRDPDPETEENEFKTEFYRRIDYANKHFNEGVPGWKTDRGRIYIYMGPPDKFEEFFTHNDPEVRGSILWWVYYDYELGIEFVDRTGMNHFELRNYTGDFFGAMEKMKLGQVGLTDQGLRVKKIDFELTYDEKAREVVVTIPQKAFPGGIQDEAVVQLHFEFFIYDRDGRRVKRFATERNLNLKEEGGGEAVRFRFPLELESGGYYIDCLVYGEAGTLPKVRKIFEVVIKSDEKEKALKSR